MGGMREARSFTVVWISISSAGLAMIRSESNMSTNRNVLVPMNFIRNDPRYEFEKPYCLSQLALPAGDEDTNLVTESQLQVVTNARLQPDWPSHFSIDSSGFTWLEHTTHHNVLDRTAETRDAYIRESSELLRDIFDASHVICYDFRVSDLCESRHCRQLM